METITTVDLHVFGDDSIVASCAVVNAVVHQPSATNQVLVDSKSRISKKLLHHSYIGTCKSCIETLQYKINHWVDR